jgi:predicted DNA-binding protein (MmcQ/YjbR family)
MANYNSLKGKAEDLPKITAKPMFGYQCYSASGKFFVGFSSKNDWQVIVRLPKEEQQIAIKTNGIKPFSHGAKMGWIEIDTSQVTTTNALKWVKKGHEYAKILAKK